MIFLSILLIIILNLMKDYRIKKNYKKYILLYYTYKFTKLYNMYNLYDYKLRKIERKILYYIIMNIFNK